MGEESDSSRRTFLKGLAAGGLGTAVAGAAYTQRDRFGGDGTGSDHDHAHVKRLVPDDQVTHRATGGAWADEGTWEESTPGDGAHVLIPEGATVTLASELAARVATVRVDGTLTTDPGAPARLRVDTLVVTGTGTLELGTADAPVGPEGETVVEFVDRGPIDEDWDPERVSRGLLALPESTVRVRGAERTPWLRTGEHPRAGDRSLTLAEAPAGWRPGDRVVLAGTAPDENQDEELTVASVDGAEVSLEERLEYDHVPPRDEFSTAAANLERPVRFVSENDAVPRRGHVMFMTKDVRVRNAGFYDLGRTDKSRPVTNPDNGTPPDADEPNPRARYACHFHRTGIDASEDPRVVRGCAVWGSPGWGYVNHNSRVDFLDNVSYEVFGSGFVAEIGNEIGSFRRNFALRSTGTGRLPDNRQFREGREGAIDDFGHGGYGFWFQGPGVAVEDNVAAGHRHHGFVYWTRPKPDREMDPEKFSGVTVDFANFPVENVEGQERLLQSDAVTDGKVPSTLVKLRSFRGNTVFASGGGLDVSRHRLGDDHDRLDEYSVVEEFTAFNIGKLYAPWDDLRQPNDGNGQGGENGVSVRYSANVILRDVTLVSGDGGHRGVAVNRNHAPTNVRIEGADVEGWYAGVRAMPRGESPIRDATLSNEVDVHVVGGGTDRRWTPAQRIDVEDVEFGDGGRASVFLGTDLQDDLYGTFSPEGHVRVDGDHLYFGTQRPDFVPFPTEADVETADEGGFDDLTSVDPAELVGKSNRELWNEYGLSVEGSIVPDDAGRRDDVERGFVAGGAGGERRDGPVAGVTSTVGSLFELGELAQDERLYVYDEERFLTVPGKYAGLPYVRPEAEDEDVERASGLALDLTTDATVFVGYDAESSAPWLDDWTDTGDTLGTTAGNLDVYRRSVEAGRTWLGGCPDTHTMYTVFVRPE